ncbi:aspartyl protease [Coleofasciculus sp. G2-EDA-02]|uniref:aspartyl protease n=1 Tax=unclassified Coleofasciculus TaxID=2692782 RepID=UPI0032F7C01A
MIAGQFSDNGELVFEIELIAANGEGFTVEAVLDTGFTTGWLAINSQDIDVLDWSIITYEIEMQTARGHEFFDLYEGKVTIDSQEFTVPVHVGDELPDVLMGCQWLELFELIVNKKKEILTLKIMASE